MSLNYSSNAFSDFNSSKNDDTPKLPSVEQKSRANFAPEFKLPLNKLTATDNIML
jgi:hypothetical protein